MEVMEEIKSNEWFHLIDHMYAKWPKINFPLIANVDESRSTSHLIPDVRNSTLVQKNMKRKKGRKRKGMQKPTKKRGLAKVQTQKTVEVRKKEGMERTVGRVSAAASSVQRRISIIQTRAQKGGSGGNVRVGLHFRQCPCCEGGSGYKKQKLLAKMQDKQEEEGKKA